MDNRTVAGILVFSIVAVFFLFAIFLIHPFEIGRAHV
jgi:hypothetical protein